MDSRILEVAAESATQFLLYNGGHFDQLTVELLTNLGKAVGADRSYVFLVHGDPNDPMMSYAYEWCDEGIEAQLDNTALHNLKFIPDYEDVLEKLQNKEPFILDTVDQGSAETCDTLSLQDIKSICMLPVWVDGRLWGFVGLDMCRCTRKWTDVEIRGLKLAAGILGAAKQKNEYQKRLRQPVDILEQVEQELARSNERHLKEIRGVRSELAALRNGEG